MSSLYSKNVNFPWRRSSSKLVPTRRLEPSSSVNIRKWEPKLGLPTAPMVPSRSVRPTVCSELSSSHGKSLCTHVTFDASDELISLLHVKSC